jgi:SAM-dependent methyltransferase
MMFGSREPFAYYSCRACDSLQIVDVPGPDDLRRHYPADYYAYDVPSASKPLRWLIGQQDRFELRFGGRVVGRSLAALPPGVRSLLGGSVVRMLGQLAIEPEARILDVGCGNGMLLDRLARVGFSNLSGADPFIAADHKTPFGVSIFKRYLSDVPGKFGLIMFNHSLEHVPDMIETLAAAAERLNPGGICLIRLPTTSCEAWTVYGADWVSVDAPRHTVIPSRVGMMLAADAVGLKVERTFDDSSSYQFFASELNRRDVALAEADSLAEILRYFGPKQIWDWEMRSERLNRQGRGEQTGFVLRAKSV